MKINLTIILFALCSFCPYLISAERITDKPLPVSTDYAGLGENIQDLSKIMSDLESDFRKKASSIHFTFKSRSCDREGHKIGEENQRFDVISYHQFDFANQIVTQFIYEGGRFRAYKFPFQASDVGDDNMGYVTIAVGSNGAKEIWFSKDGVNLGYDYQNGLRWSFYCMSSN